MTLINNTNGIATPATNTDFKINGIIFMPFISGK